MPTAINIQLGSNGILRTDQAQAVSETTKTLLSNKLGRPVSNIRTATPAITSLEVSNAAPGTQPLGNAVVVTQVARNEMPSQPVLKAVPVSIRIAADPDTNGPRLREDVNDVQVQSSNLSRLLTEPLCDNSQPNRKWVHFAIVLPFIYLFFCERQMKI